MLRAVGDAERPESAMGEFVASPLIISGQLDVLPAELREELELSRCTQFPEYDLKGCFAALKSRNSPNCLYSNPGQKPMHGKRMVSLLPA